DAYYALRFGSSYLIHSAYDGRGSASICKDTGSRDFLSAGSSSTALNPGSNLTAALDNKAPNRDDGSPGQITAPENVSSETYTYPDEIYTLTTWSDTDKKLDLG